MLARQHCQRELAAPVAAIVPVDPRARASAREPPWATSAHPRVIHTAASASAQAIICKNGQAGPNGKVCDAKGACVYWTYEQPPFRWECLNDGTCAQSIGGRGTFSSKEDCESNCGRGKWSCMQNAILPDCAGEKATMCVPSPQGYCTNVTECETFCSTP